MYDTLRFRLNCLEREKRDLLSKFDFQEGRYPEHWSCQLDNLIIKVHGSIITVEGSLVKFHEGNNLCSLNRETTKQAIDLLGDRLHLDIKSAHVTRIDIAANFEMSHNAKEYLPFLGYYPRHKRDLKYRTSLYYGTNGHTCLFYDKGKELQGKKGMESCLLRFESRWFKSLSAQLKWKNITGGTLSDLDFYRYIIQLWSKNYFDIKKRNIPLPKPNVPINTAKKAKDCLFSALLSSSMESTEELRMFLIEQLDPQNKSRFNRMLNDLNDDFTINKMSPLMEELDSKIRDRVSLELSII